jgi:hypothetical protein
LFRFRFRIRALPWRHTKCDFKVTGTNVSPRLLLDPQLVKQNLVENYLSDLAVDLPDVGIQRWHRALVFLKNLFGHIAQLKTQ